MSVAEKISYDQAIKLIEDIGGYDPITEAKDLLDISFSNSDFNGLIKRRVTDHEPVAYMTNHSRFRGLDLYIDRRVLIPRTETEPLVEVAVDELPLGASVIDVGTGCGAVALAVKNERRDLKVMGSDISKDALDVASINSVALELDVEWQDADLIEGIKGEFDAVLANMPYLPTTKRDSYEPEMTEYEPEIALWGGEDGFDLIRRLLTLTAAKKSVKLVALECGRGQHEDISELVRKAGFPIVFCTTDKRNEIRCVIGKR